MKSLLSYRRIPFRWVTGGIEAAGTEEAPGPVLAPKIVWPDDTVANDSTFLIKMLESRYSGRSVIPTDPRLAFLVSLVEDCARCPLVRGAHSPLSPSLSLNACRGGVACAFVRARRR